MGNRLSKARYFMCDFETTVYDGQERTDVWAAAITELFGPETAYVAHSIDEMFGYFRGIKGNIIAYFHNLKFDGEFIACHLLSNLGLKQAYEIDETGNYSFMKTSDMPTNSFKYSISSKGQWYTMTIKFYKQVIEIRDSLKLLPFSVATLGNGFKTKHRKSTMEYKGYRYPGCEITPVEQEYIKNDVFVPREALEQMFMEGHDKLTIGSCCLSEFKAIFKKETAFDYDEIFPDQYQVEDKSGDYTSVGRYILKSYKGAYCHLVKGKANKVFYDGCTLDVSSLYPYVMHSMSGNRYPVGQGNYFKGDIPDIAKQSSKYYFVRVRTRFYLKEGKLPYIQIKGNKWYKGTEHLETSDIYDKSTGKYYKYYTDINGDVQASIVTMTLTCTDWVIIQDSYDLVDTEIIDGYWYFTEIGLFDKYIDKYRKQKETSSGPRRTVAKLLSNNLYGKEAANDDSSFKIMSLNEDGSIRFTLQEEFNKTPGYIPIGSAITSYARRYSYKAASLNYYGPDKPGFIYCDTDSIHVDLPIEQIKGVELHPTQYGLWKAESEWDYAIFARQKTYIEHVIAEDQQPVTPWYNVKCAGMPERCKKLLIESFTGYAQYEDCQDRTEEELEFLFDENHNRIYRQITDFKLGLKVPGKLFPKHIPGGVLLEEGYYTMR